MYKLKQIFNYNCVAFSFIIAVTAREEYQKVHKTRIKEKY